MLNRDVPFPAAEYARMGKELKAAAEALRSRPEINSSLAERLALLANSICEDATRAHSRRKVSG